VGHKGKASTADAAAARAELQQLRHIGVRHDTELEAVRLEGAAARHELVARVAEATRGAAEERRLAAEAGERERQVMSA